MHTTNQEHCIQILHLERSFLDPHFLVYAYNISTLYPDSSFRKGHCFYQGYAAEIPKSAVTLNTCSGLRGLLQLENISYGIEPLESAAKYEHVLYQIKNNKVDFLPLQDNYPMIQLGDQAYRILVKSEKKSDVALLKRTLKIQVIMDKALVCIIDTFHYIFVLCLNAEGIRKRNMLSLQYRYILLCSKYVPQYSRA
ncbi:PREDICTED: disintegrin and metalloproteinase domain-containing protein 18-like [Miniopterus natalensis]|uniref:disintegrin and metalloproteinase domain-containing protein 18-like n=1 Tax=Miniopterus natalensis TaxID=291302 RepID=UPI0007A6ED38|nr:PREDICTED: disintegrin and metalloproteinase domain-containing protein 18-like [Miniopterus natalensis]